MFHLTTENSTWLIWTHSAAPVFTAAVIIVNSDGMWLCVCVYIYFVCPGQHNLWGAGEAPEHSQGLGGGGTTALGLLTQQCPDEHDQGMKQQQWIDHEVYHWHVHHMDKSMWTHSVMRSGLTSSSTPNCLDNFFECFFRVMFKREANKHTSPMLLSLRHGIEVWNCLCTPKPFQTAAPGRFNVVLNLVKS